MKFLTVQGAEGLQFLHISPSLIGKMRAHQLEKLYFRGMNSLKELLIGETILDSDWRFQSLDDLVFADLQKMESIIWKGVVPHVCLPTLRFLVIVGCHSIKTLTWIKELPCLKEVYLINCNSMLELVADDEAEGNMSTVAASFPGLKLLGLSQLGDLHNICGGTISFPCLQRLLVYKCPVLVKLPSGLLTEERVPLILGRQDWWEQLCWEDSSVESTLFPFFRELPASFRGGFVDVGKALVM
jgi:disease resistance protein RPS2